MSVVFARVHFFIEAPIRQPNKMVDALSQCVTLLSTIRTHIPGFDTLCELYLADALFNQIYVDLLEGGKQDNYVLLNCYFFRGSQLCIPACSLREHIIHELYYEWHFRRDKMLALVSTYYYRPKLPGQVSNFVKKCAIR